MRGPPFWVINGMKDSGETFDLNVSESPGSFGWLFTSITPIQVDMGRRGVFRAGGSVESIIVDAA